MTMHLRTTRTTLSLPNHPGPSRRPAHQVRFRTPTTPMTQNKRLLHPTTQRPLFGFIPALPAMALGEPLPVLLTYGRHTPVRDEGMGALHIWKGHGKNLHLPSIEEVPEFVASVLVPGTPLYRAESPDGSLRLIAHRRRTGLVVLGHRDKQYFPHWSVITAYSKYSPYGEFVGTIRSAEE